MNNFLVSKHIHFLYLLNIPFLWGLFRTLFTWNLLMNSNATNCFEKSKPGPNFDAKRLHSPQFQDTIFFPLLFFNIKASFESLNEFPFIITHSNIYILYHFTFLENVSFFLKRMNFIPILFVKFEIGGGEIIECFLKKLLCWAFKYFGIQLFKHFSRNVVALWFSIIL